MPALAASLTRKNPGSLMPGVPASLISAMFCPPFSRSTTAAEVSCSLNLWWDIRRFSIPKCLSRMPDVRVSSASIRSTSLSILIALNVMSSMLPTGVGMIYNMPILATNVLISRQIIKKISKNFANFKTVL